MNKQIKDIAEQAKLYAECSTKDYTGDEPVGFMDYYTEKFAELIIQECSALADKHFGSAHFGMGVSGIMIKEHFGVE